jgi:hypothetical protein
MSDVLTRPITADLPIDLESEKLLSMAQAARLFPPNRGNRPVHPSTVSRWIVNGVLLRDGQRARLEGVVRPSGWFTSAEAVQRFLAVLTHSRGVPQSPPAMTTGRSRASERISEAARKIVGSRPLRSAPHAPA